MRRAVQDTLPLIVAAVLVSGVLVVAQAPTPTLFGGLVAGAALALSGHLRAGPGPVVVRLSQAATPSGPTSAQQR